MKGQTTTTSPISSVPFKALGHNWTLKFGQRQRFRIEREFGIGWGGAIMDTFAGLTPELIEEGAPPAIQAAIKPEDVKMGAIVMLFACCLLEQPDDDMVDALVEELGYARVCELIGAAITEGNPKQDAPGTATDAASGADGGVPDAGEVRAG